MATPAREGRLIWTGRFGGTIAEGLDGWSCGRSELLLMLANASELVVLDPLSFPWELLRRTDWDIPFVVALPGDLDSDRISLVLGAPMLSHLTPFDALIDHRREVRQALTAEWGLDERTWLPTSGASIEATVDTVRARSCARLVTVETEYGSFLAQTDDTVTAHLQEYGAHQRGTLNVLLALVRPDDVVIDIGAHVGTFAIPIAQRLDSTGKIIAIEGCRATATLLTANVEANALTDRITVLQAVVGDAAGAKVRPQVAPGNTGATSFLPSRELSRFAQPVATLDELTEVAPEVRRATVLKIDVEGAEMSTLAGAAGLLTEARPLIACEISSHTLHRHGRSVAELDRWFAAANYRILQIAGARNSRDHRWVVTPLERLLDCREGHFDALAIPRESTRLDDLGLEGEV